jgi:hypothetical protein
VRLKQRYELCRIVITEAVTLCANRAVPCSSYRKAREPAHQGKSQTPETDDRDEAYTDPSHLSGLEDAEKLDEERQLDYSSLHTVYAVFDVEGLVELESARGLVDNPRYQ